MRLAQADRARRGGPGEATVRRIERGEAGEVRPRTKSQLEMALDWPAGGIDRTLEGTVTLTSSTR